MTAVSDLVTALNRDAFFVAEDIRAEWVSTGGGCYAVAVNFGDRVSNAPAEFRFEILITDRDDVFTSSDMRTDYDVGGFLACLYVYDDTGERMYADRDPVVLYHTRWEAGPTQREADESNEPVNLSIQVEGCAWAVSTAVANVADAWGNGRK